MIEKILAKFEELRNVDICKGITCAECEKICGKGDCANNYQFLTISKVKEIVQEVAKEYGKDKNVPSNGWIPVETELPKEDGMYLCTVLHANKYNTWIMRFKNGEFVRPDDVEGLDYEVLAWQRIAPYQKGE